MASDLKKNSSDKIIEDILNETSNPQFSLICQTNSVVSTTEMDHVKVDDNIVSLPTLIQGGSDSHSNSELLTLATSSEASESSLETVGVNLVAVDNVVSPPVTVGITGFETVVDDIVEEAGDHVTLEPQSELTVIEELNYTDNNGVLIPKFEDSEDVTLEEEVNGQVTSTTGENTTVDTSVQPQAQPVNVGTLVGVTDIGGNLVTIGGQHFILFTAGNPGCTEIQGQTHMLVQPAVSTQDCLGQPALKRLRTEDTLTSPLTEEGVESLVGFDAAHPNVQVEVIEEERIEHEEVEELKDVVEGSTDITKNWFTTRDDKNRLKLQHKGSTWKQGQWSKDEVELLKSNIDKYCQLNNIVDPGEIIFDMSKDERKNFYRIIAVGLNRPLFSVYRRVIRMYDQKNHLGKYTPAEVDKLRELREKLGPDWAAIGAKLGRSASSVKDRCRLMKERCYSGKWLPDEEKLLTDAVYRLSGAMPGMDVTGGLSWAAVAEQVGSRTEKQCRTKWLNYLNWKNRGGTEWSRADDFLLIDKVYNMNVTEEVHINWEQLAKGWSSARSPQWLRGKWWSLKRHVIPDNHNMKFKAILEQLKANMKDLSRPAVSRPDLQFAVKIEKPHTVSHTQTASTTASCYDGTVTSTTGMLTAGDRSAVHSTNCTIEESVTTLETGSLIHSLTHPQAEAVTDSESLIMYTDSSQSGQQMVLVYPDQSTSDTQQVLQIELKKESPMMSSAVSD